MKQNFFFRGLFRLGVLLLAVSSVFSFGQDSSEQPEPSQDRPCLVFADGRKVLLESLPDVDGSLVHFTLESGKGPFTVRKNDLDWVATESGCPLPKAQGATAQAEAKVITTEDLGKGGGGGAFSIDGSTHSGFSPHLQAPGGAPPIQLPNEITEAAEEPTREKNWAQEWKQIKMRLRAAEENYVRRVDESHRLAGQSAMVRGGPSPLVSDKDYQAALALVEEAEANLKQAEKELHDAQVAKDDFLLAAAEAGADLDG